MPLYKDGQEVRVGDVFRSSRNDVYQYDTWQVTSLDEGYIGWRHLQTDSCGKKPLIHQTIWTLVSRAAPVEKKRSGFSKFIRSIES